MSDIWVSRWAVLPLEHRDAIKKIFISRDNRLFNESGTSYRQRDSDEITIATNKLRAIGAASRLIKIVITSAFA